MDRAITQISKSDIDDMIKQGLPEDILTRATDDGSNNEVTFRNYVDDYIE